MPLPTRLRSLALMAAVPVVAALVQQAPTYADPGDPVAVPAAAQAVDTSHPDRWVGNGTAASCTSRAVVRAVAKGGVIRFRCGPDPVRIEMTRTAKVVNTSRRVVIDGGGLVTLSGGGERRILYQNTCDPRQTWTTDHCDDQSYPRLVDRTGDLVIRSSMLEDNPSDGFESSPGIFFLGDRRVVEDSVVR